MIIRDFAPCKEKWVSLDWKKGMEISKVWRVEEGRTIPRAMVFALLLGAPGTLKRKSLMTETPIAARERRIWMMWTGNL